MCQSDRIPDQPGTDEGRGRMVDLKLETLAGIVEERAIGPANVKLPKSTEVRRWNCEIWEDRSSSSLMDGTELKCTWPSD